MPIFEFRCIECQHVFEELFINTSDQVELSCPECKAESLERVVSVTNYAVGAGSGIQQPKVTTKSCSAGNECTTLDLPGHVK